MTSPALVLVTEHWSSAAGRQALHPHMDPRPQPSRCPSCPCKILSPTLNNSVRSRSLPPEGLVSWRHHWDDLTAPERSGVFSVFFFFFYPSSQPPFTHTHLCHTHVQINLSLIHKSQPSNLPHTLNRSFSLQQTSMDSSPSGHLPLPQGHKYTRTHRHTHR